MRKATQKMTGEDQPTAKAPYAPSAQVVDGTLILSLPDAISPVVWQMELGKTKASAIEVREEGSAHKLVLKTPQADVYHIADYADRDRATDALLTVSSAMRMAQGQLRPEEAKTALVPVTGKGKFAHPDQSSLWKRYTPFGWLWQAIKWTISLIVLGIGLFMLVTLARFYLFTYAGNGASPTAQETSQTAPQTQQQLQQQQQPAAPEQKRPSETVGKPVSGDAFLQDLQNR
ncbi:MAG: hypothetical protein AB7E85_04895 [Pseudobdellovibrionaceae bacterium]